MRSIVKSEIMVLSKHNKRYPYSTVQYIPNHENMRKKVHLHCLLMTISTPFGIWKCRLIDTSITNETIKGLGHLEFLQIITEFLNRVERIELKLHWSEIIQIELIQFCNCFHLINIADGADDMILSCTKQGLGCLAPESRRCACDDN